VLNTAAWTALVAGLAFGLSLIVVIGPQNAYVLRQGVLRHHVPTIVTICSFSDAVLIAAGVGGASAVLSGRQWLLSVVRVAGAAFLFGYGVLAARRACRPAAARTGGEANDSSWTAAAGACLVFTWLNPAVYLDTVVLLGSVANTRPGHQWWFGGGAVVASVLWFTALGFGARLLEAVFERPRAWQALDVFVAVVMVGTGLRVLVRA
jgi:L-lysine exporter family protein LysE/ArgO